MSPTFHAWVFEKRPASRGNITIISYFYEFNPILRAKGARVNGIKENDRD